MKAKRDARCLTLFFLRVYPHPTWKGPVSSLLPRAVQMYGGKGRGGVKRT